MSYEEFRDAGFYKMDIDETPYVAFADFRADPGANPLGTPSGKFEIHSDDDRLLTAMTTRPAHRSGSSRRSGWAARSPRTTRCR